MFRTLVKAAPGLVLLLGVAACSGEGSGPPGLVLLLGVAACSGEGSGPPGAEQAAEKFHAAVQSGEYGQACSMLAPATLEDSQQAEDGGEQPCTDKLGAVSLASPGTPVTSQAFGRNAQVVFESDTVFLTLSNGTWKVMAAGCTPRGERPYSCLIEGD